MSFIERAKDEPWLFDFFTTLRRFERSFPDRPRIGDTAATRDEYVFLGQDPYLEFPASNLSSVSQDARGRYRVLVKFLGLLGPQGALPLSTTEEAYHWVLARDDVFPRFLDLFNHRFLQLFFRAWADARPIAQHDRPRMDRFVTYIGSTVGIGSVPYHDLDSVPDATKLIFAGLMGPAARGASRLRSLIKGMFGVEAEIHEFIGSHLQFDEGERTRLGAKNSSLGQDLMMGASVFSVGDKFRIRIYVDSMDEYKEFLPTGNRCEPLAEIVYFYIGEQLEWEVQLAIPAGVIEPVRLSKFGQLGWTTWMAPNWAKSDEAYRMDARFHPADILKQKRQQAS